MRPRPIVVALFATLWALVAFYGCGGSSQGSGGAGGVPSGAIGSTGGGMDSGTIFTSPDGGDASDAPVEAAMNPCGTKCGSIELCDPAHIGTDDNCNGLVDEGCTCAPGAVHWCFKGDPSYHNQPGCFDGLETCTENGMWSDCVGGVHAWPPYNCQDKNPACHAISGFPNVPVHLKPGTGTFSANAIPGSEVFTVECPIGATKCPSVQQPDVFSDIQSGQYTVTYSKMVVGDPQPETCTYPLFIGDRGLRVELVWEHTPADLGVDLDLHVHQPLNTQPWAISPGEPQDCTWSSCRIDEIVKTSMIVPHWFTGMQPMPCDWDIQTNAQSLDNTCYTDPVVGMAWQSLGMGCHNPRSDIDVIQCDDTVTNSSDQNWCGPENINVDYPPMNQWFRIAVHYYYNHGRTYDVHPEVKVFCNGALFGDLGPLNFYMPEAPVTFAPADGAGVGTGNRFWLVADVAFVMDSCMNVTCVVQPLYSDPGTKTPAFMIDTAATSTWSPPWPPPPM
jgi:hypothetical protein